MPSDDGTVARAIRQLYAAGIHPDWWKLPPPGSPRAWRQIEAAVGEHDPRCRGVLLLGLGASEEELRAAFSLAAGEPLCKGFAIGRSVFADAADRWFAGRLDD